MVTQTALKKKERFFPLTTREWDMISRKLTHSQLLVYYHLKTLIGPWGDCQVEVSIKEVAEKLGLDRSTVSRAIKYLNHEKLIDLELLNIRLLRVSADAAEGYGKRDRHAQQCDRHAQQCDRHAQEMGAAIALPIYKDRARAEDSLDYIDPQEGGVENFKEKEELVTPTTLQGKFEALYEKKNVDRDQSFAALPVTQQNITVEAHADLVEFHQEVGPAGRDGQPGDQAHADLVEFHQEVGPAGRDGQPGDQAHADLVEFHQEVGPAGRDGQPGDQAHADLVEFHQGNISINDYPAALANIPRALLKRVKLLNISFDDQIIGAIKEAHLSQLIATLNHIEATREDIKSPRGVFLFQIKKAPVEHLGLRQPLFTAADVKVEDAVPPPTSFKNMLAKLVEKKRMEALGQKSVL